MNQPARIAGTQTATDWLADRVLDAKWEHVAPAAVTVAKQCLLDWIGVAIAARQEPLVEILSREFADEPQKQECTLIGRDGRVSMATAALINGAMGHALDFDDVITGMGHPTAPVAPAVLATGEALGSSGRELLLSFILGVEAETRVGYLVGPSHYADGWHATATLGTFGATAGCAKLMKLTKDQLLHAFGLAGTQAAGLKSVFGTMSKPFHPGKSAQNGILAARLGRAGFTSQVDILGVDQGFADTQSTSVNVEAMTLNGSRFVVEDALFKYHAACYMTHDTIEACNAIRRGRNLRPDDVESVLVKVRQAHLKVCNIQQPRTGLECKFSLRMTTAMALTGEDTFDNELYTDATANRSDLVALRNRVVVEPTGGPRGATVEVKLKNGERVTQSSDVAIPLRNLEEQQAKIERKFNLLATPIVGSERASELIERVKGLEKLERVDQLLSLTRS